MNSLKPSTRHALFDRLLTLALLTTIAFVIAIAPSTLSSVVRAAEPQKCPTGTVLNSQTHACDLVKAPTVAAPAAIKPIPPGNLGLNVPAPAPCNGHGTMSSMGSCSCNANYNGSSCGNCNAGFTGYPNCQAVNATCPAGTYGASCSACPGGASNVCSSHGTCSQGVAGNGTCTCFSGFNGLACQYSNGTSQ
jgi:hypothetical protein